MLRIRVNRPHASDEHLYERELIDGRQVYVPIRNRERAISLWRCARENREIMNRSIFNGANDMLRTLGADNLSFLREMVSTQPLESVTQLLKTLLREQFARDSRDRLPTLLQQVNDLINTYAGRLNDQQIHSINTKLYNLGQYVRRAAHPEEYVRETEPSCSDCGQPFHRCECIVATNWEEEPTQCGGCGFTTCRCEPEMEVVRNEFDQMKSSRKRR